MTQDILTIIIVNYKTPHLVTACIDSAKKYAPKSANMGLRFIVVDNSENDGSLEIMQAAHPEITCLDAGGNVGFSKGCNIALRRLETPYAMLLNSDTLMEDGTLEKLLRTLQDNPQVGAIGARVVNPDGTDQDYPTRFPSIPEMIKRMVFGPQFPAKKTEEGSTPIHMQRIHGCCLLMRQNALNDVGLLDERFFMYEEDMDWCLRARQKGWKLWLLPDAKVVHIGGQSSGRAPSGKRGKDAKTVQPFNPRMSYELRKSRYLLYRKHCFFLDIMMLKFLTDTALLVGALGCIAKSVLQPAIRAHMMNRLKAYGAIMAINPFRFPKAP